MLGLERFSVESLVMKIVCFLLNIIIWPVLLLLFLYGSGFFLSVLLAAVSIFYFWAGCFAFLGMVGGLVLYVLKKKKVLGLAVFALSFAGMLYCGMYGAESIPLFPDEWCEEKGICEVSVMSKEKCLQEAGYWEDDTCFLKWSKYHPENRKKNAKEKEQVRNLADFLEHRRTKRMRDANIR